MYIEEQIWEIRKIKKSWRVKWGGEGGPGIRVSK